MINAHDLRIGNWIQARNRHDYEQKSNVRVDSISHEGIGLSAQDNGIYGLEVEAEYAFDDITGIPLTPELLQQAGFIDNYREVDNGTIIFHPSDNEVSVFGPAACTSGHAFYISNIQFVHQLQNLIYDLTGQELTLTL